MKHFKKYKAVYSTLIIGVGANILFVIIQSIYQFLYDSKGFWDSFSQFFRIKISFEINLWLLIVLIPLILYFLSILLKNKLFKKLNNSNKNEKIELDKTIIKNIQILKRNEKDELESDFLKNDKGTFLIWAKITTDHNTMKDRRIFQYIIGHSEGKGKAINNPKLARYPNAWAICRIPPFKADEPFGEWVFWCNATEEKKVRLSSTKVLGSGWHLFTVKWNKEVGRIDFYLDDELQKRSDEFIWPQYFEVIKLGDWPESHPSHKFNSEIGDVLFTKKELNNEEIKRIFNENKKLL